MLKKIRIALAALFFVGITLLFVGIGHDWWGWMAKAQFVPSVFRTAADAVGMNLAVTAGILLLTLVCGRIYCSVICPMGVFQDLMNWLSSRRKGKKNRFHFRKDLKWLRYAVLLLFCIAAFLDIQLIVALVEPYSAYGRIVRSIVSPLGMGWALVGVAAATLVAIAFLAWSYGRLYCNTICPVGTFLGIISKHALFRPTIDTDVCVGCHSCEKKCKASCIDSDSRTIDYSRCVDCFDCIGDCKVGAIRYQFAYGSPKPAGSGTDSGRRAFLTGTLVAAGTSALHAQTKLDGGLADIAAKKKPERTERIVPAGAGGLDSFYDKCTACQLCVSACPNHVLRPSTDLGHFMQPESSYEDGYCRPECTECSKVCPAGAILPITPEEKTAIHIGRAVVDLDLCLVNTDGVSCGNCARHCPAGAIYMVSTNPKKENAPRVPSVNEEKCIGCGACEFLCPARPYSAIHVNGLKEHVNG